MWLARPVFDMSVLSFWKEEVRFTAGRTDNQPTLPTSDATGVTGGLTDLQQRAKLAGATVIRRGEAAACLSSLGQERPVLGSAPLSANQEPGHGDAQKKEGRNPGRGKGLLRGR